MKICCYEKFITRSSGAADTSVVCDARGGPWVLLPLRGLCLGPHPGPDWCPLNLETFGQNGSFERGTSLCTLPPPLRKIPAPSRFGWILARSEGQLPRGCSPRGALSCF